MASGRVPTIATILGRADTGGDRTTRNGRPLRRADGRSQRATPDEGQLHSLIANRTWVVAVLLPAPAGSLIR